MLRCRDLTGNGGSTPGRAVEEVGVSTSVVVTSGDAGCHPLKEV